MTCIDQMTPTFDGVAAFGEIATRRPLECRLANNCGPLANPKDSPAEAGLLTCLRGSNSWVVSRIFRTFDQATASVCMSCG